MNFYRRQKADFSFASFSFPLLFAFRVYNFPSNSNWEAYFSKYALFGQLEKRWHRMAHTGQEVLVFAYGNGSCLIIK